jgi:hypothetical protein
MKAMTAINASKIRLCEHAEPQCGQIRAVFRMFLPQDEHFLKSKKPLKPQNGQGTSMLAVFWPQSGHLP